MLLIFLKFFSSLLILLPRLIFKNLIKRSTLFQFQTIQFLRRVEDEKKIKSVRFAKQHLRPMKIYLNINQLGKSVWLHMKSFYNRVKIYDTVFRSECKPFKSVKRWVRDWIYCHHFSIVHRIKRWLTRSSYCCWSFRVDDDSVAINCRRQSLDKIHDVDVWRSHTSFWIIISEERKVTGNSDTLFISWVK